MMSDSLVWTTYYVYLANVRAFVDRSGDHNKLLYDLLVYSVGRSDPFQLIYNRTSTNNVSAEHGLNGVHRGGHWSPTECMARQRIAIIIPFRDRHAVTARQMQSDLPNNRASRSPAPAAIGHASPIAMRRLRRQVHCDPYCTTSRQYRCGYSSLRSNRYVWVYTSIWRNPMKTQSANHLSRYSCMLI